MKILILAAALALAGCETMAPQPNPYASFHPELDQASDRCDASFSPAVKSALAGKLRVGSSGNRSMQMMANKNTATDSEKAAISEYVDTLETCRAEFLSIHERYGFNGIASILRAMYSSSNAAYADLYSGQTTYGDANKQLEQIQSKGIAAIEEYARAMDRQQAQAAEQSRLQSILLLQQWSAMRPTIPAPNPTTTCTTSAVFGQLRTVCR